MTATTTDPLLSDQNVLLAAAALAANQPSVTQAICCALGFLDRFPGALARLKMACRTDTAVSLAFCLRRPDSRAVAAAIRGAAIPEGAVL
jgi:hypothetical protein